MSAAGHHLPFAELDDLFDVADLRELEFFRNLRPDLGGVAVDGLAAAEDQIDLADLLRAAGERIACRKGIGSGERAVGHQNRFIRTAVKRLPENLGGSRHSHRGNHHADAVTVFELQGQFQRIQILRIEDRRERGPVHGPFRRHCVAGDVLGIRNLFDEHEYGITHSFDSHFG